MHSWKMGDRARIVLMPERGKHLVGQIVTVGRIGGFGIEPDDVAVRGPGGMLFVSADQLAPVDSSRSTR
jgi:hypothetical protein